MNLDLLDSDELAWNKNIYGCNKKENSKKQHHQAKV